MTSKNPAESSSETKFAHDAKLDFAVKSIRNKKFAEWAAAIMHLDRNHIEDYIKDVLKTEFENKADEAVIRKVYNDIHKFGDSKLSHKEVESMFARFTQEAIEKSKISDKGNRIDR